MSLAYANPEEAMMGERATSQLKRSARLFRNGRSQAVRIPREFEFTSAEVAITQLADGKLMIEPKPKDRISPMLAWLEANGPIEDFPTDPGDEGLLPLDDINL